MKVNRKIAKKSRKKVVEEVRRRSPNEVLRRQVNAITSEISNSVSDEARLALLDEISPPENVNRLSPRDSLIAIMTAKGMNTVEIAKELGTTPQTISTTRNRPDVRRWIAAVQLHLGVFKAEDLFKELLPEAIFRLASIMRHADKEGVSLRAIEQIIERVMGKTMQPIEHHDVALKDLLDRMSQMSPITALPDPDAGEGDLN